MFSLLQELHKNDVELKIDKAPTGSGNDIMRFTLRSGNGCMVRYLNLDGPRSNAEDATLLRLLHIFYEEFMEEKGRREYLAETLVSTYEQEQEDFLQERRKVLAENRVSTATDGGDICGQERQTEEER